MNLDDHSWLSAYLDDELSSEQRQAAEAALASDPPLAAELRGLQRVHELIAGLPRSVPADLDVSTAVAQRLALYAQGRRPWSPRRRAWTASLGAAAAVGLLLVLPASWRLFRPPGPVAVPAPAPAPVRADLAARPSPPERPDHAGQPSSAPSAELVTTAATAPVAAPEPARLHAGASRQADLQRVRALLDDPRLRKVFLVTDEIGESLEGQVASLVERTTRQDFFKITVAEGIVIDPAHPGKATVFAVVLDRNELEPFRDRLQSTFRDRVRENEVEPAILAQLTDLGDVVSLPGHPVGDVTIPPPDQLALRVPERAGSIFGPRIPAPASATDQPTLEQERSRPNADLGRPNADMRRPNADMRRPVPARASAREGAGSPTLAEDVAGAAPPPSVRPAETPAEARRDASQPDDRRLIVLVWLTAPGSG